MKKKCRASEVLIIIPAYNEERMIGKVIEGVQQEEFRNIVVVDDGSVDRTGRMAKDKGVVVLTHFLNRGLGAALKTGFEYAKFKNFDLVVTFDADGQHQAKDIKRMIRPIMEKKKDVVIGSRFKGDVKQMNLLRKLINNLSNLATFILFGVWTTDSQSGLRAFSKKALRMIQLRTEKMEVSSEIFKEIRRNHLKLAEIPIKAIYTDYSINKGQKNRNAFDVFFKLLIGRFR